MQRTCAGCGHAADSNFCPECGADMRPDRKCSNCGADLPPGARFCTECGRPATSSGQGDGLSRLGWVTLSLALLLVATGSWLLLGPGLGGAEPSPAGQAGAPAEPAGVDLSSMTPRQAADRLFGRVLENMAQGDTAEAGAFLPMAIAAYERVPAGERDPMYRYRVGVLHQFAGRPSDTHAQADTILASYPQHLLGLFMAGESAQVLGDEGAAEEYYRRFLDAFREEIDSPRPEYRAHVEGLAAMRQHADSYLQGR
jgi:hypothetical protein